MYVRADGPIGQTSGVAKEALIKVTKTDVSKPVRAEDEVFNRLTAFLYALEYLNVMPFDQDGAMLFLKELTWFRGKNPGMEYLVEVDSLVRNEVEDIGRHLELG